MDKNIDKYWKKVGVEMLLSYAQLFKINYSEEEMYDMVFEEEYLNDEVYEYFDPKLIACAKVWDIIRGVILKYWENVDLATDSEFILKTMKKFHDTLNVTGEYSEYFDPNKEIGKNFLSGFMKMRNELLISTSINSFCEYLAIFILKCIQEIKDNVTVYEYIAYWTQGAIIFKGYNPIIFKERNELLEFIEKIQVVAKRLKTSEIPPKDWLSQVSVQEIVAELVSTSEEFGQSY